MKTASFSKFGAVIFFLLPGLLNYGCGEKELSIGFENASSEPLFVELLGPGEGTGPIGTIAASPGFVFWKVVVDEDLLPAQYTWKGGEYEGSFTVTPETEGTLCIRIPGGLASYPQIRRSRSPDYPSTAPVSDEDYYAAEYGDYLEPVPADITSSSDSRYYAPYFSSGVHSSSTTWLPGGGTLVNGRFYPRPLYHFYSGPLYIPLNGNSTYFWIGSPYPHRHYSRRCPSGYRYYPRRHIYRPYGLRVRIKCD